MGVLGLWDTLYMLNTADVDLTVGWWPVFLGHQSSWWRTHCFPALGKLLHSVSFTVGHYYHFPWAISLAQTQLLLSWFTHCHSLPKASGDKAVWGRRGSGMGQCHFAFDLCYSITAILYPQGLYCKGFSDTAPVRCCFCILSRIASAPASVVLGLGW